MKKTLLFVCASGIATSTVLTEKVLAYLKEKGMDKIDYRQTNVSSVESQVEGVDLIIATSKVPYELDVPVIAGLPLLTGMGEKETLEKIYETLVG